VRGVPLRSRIVGARATARAGAPAPPRRGGDSSQDRPARPARTGRKNMATTTTSGGKTGGIHAPVQPSPELGAIVGNEKLPRSQVISKVWDYIKSNNLQNPENKREIVADEKLKKVFGRDKVTMFEMNKYISQHVKA
jgi:chromatin remodeling complex protein RSC6